MEELISAKVLNTATVKVLNYFATFMNLEFEVTKKEIAEGAEISRTTLMEIWPLIEKLELLIPTKKVGPAQLYKINKSSKVLLAWKQFELQLVAKYTQETKSIETQIIQVAKIAEKA
ncbi:MAG: hypothetical protein HY929_03445 [Euryarchaeota archaeon]|nr:hypothetical protein [Euryarchaeota archaeon]